MEIAENPTGLAWIFSMFFRHPIIFSVIFAAALVGIIFLVVSLSNKKNNNSTKQNILRAKSFDSENKNNNK